MILRLRGVGQYESVGFASKHQTANSKQPKKRLLGRHWTVGSVEWVVGGAQQPEASG